MLSLRCRRSQELKSAPRLQPTLNNGRIAVEFRVGASRQKVERLGRKMDAQCILQCLGAAQSKKCDVLKNLKICK